MGFEKFAASTVKDFEVVEEIFRNQAGSIAKVRFKYDNKYYVLKEIAISEAKSRRNAINEVTLLQQLNHPNVVRFYGHFWDDSQRHGGATQSLFIVLEYCECGDLGRLIAARRRQQQQGGDDGETGLLEEAYVWRTFHQICLGVQHLHQNGIVHRDLKGLNVLLVNNGRTAKVADLGVSRQVAEQESMLKTFIGTPLYLSPELVDGAHYTEKTDIWSLGVLLYELCALAPPFRAASISSLGRAIKNGQYPPLPARYSPSLSRVVASLLQQNYTKRPSITQLIERVEHHIRPEASEEKTVEKIVAPSPREPEPKAEPQPLPSSSSSSASLHPGPEGAPGRDQIRSQSQQKPAYVRRSVLDEGNMGEIDRERWEQRQRQRQRPSGSGHSEEGQPNGPSSQPDNGDGSGLNDGLVQVDVNRLGVAERRERNVLRKLLQAKELISSDSVADSVSGNSSGRSSSIGTNQHNKDEMKAGSEGELGASLLLAQRVLRSQEVLALLGKALSAGGRISAEDAATCNIPLVSPAPQNVSKQGDRGSSGGRGGVLDPSPISTRGRAWPPPSCEESARQETPPEIQLHSDRRLMEEDGTTRDIFHENKSNRHSIFSENRPHQRPASSSSSSAAVQSSPHQSRPNTAAPLTFQQQQREQRRRHQQQYFEQRQEQEEHEKKYQAEHRQPHSAGSSRGHVRNSHQQRSHRSTQRHLSGNHGHHIGNASNPDLLSHRDEVYGREGGSGHSNGSHSQRDSRQFRRVCHLSPTRQGSAPAGPGRFNIISGKFESS